jgi:hypothetical protein
MTVGRNRTLSCRKAVRALKVGNNLAAALAGPSKTDFDLPRKILHKRVKHNNQSTSKAAEKPCFREELFCPKETQSETCVTYPLSLSSVRSLKTVGEVLRVGLLQNE